MTRIIHHNTVPRTLRVTIIPLVCILRCCVLTKQGPSMREPLQPPRFCTKSVLLHDRHHPFLCGNPPPLIRIFARDRQDPHAFIRWRIHRLESHGDDLGSDAHLHQWTHVDMLRSGDEIAYLAYLCPVLVWIERPFYTFEIDREPENELFVAERCGSDGTRGGSEPGARWLMLARCVFGEASYGRT